MSIGINVALSVELQEARMEVARLRAVLDQLHNGILIDERNHDDNGLPELIQRCVDKYTCVQLRKMDRLVQAALAAKEE